MMVDFALRCQQFQHCQHGHFTRFPEQSESHTVVCACLGLSSERSDVFSFALCRFIISPFVPDHLADVQATGKRSKSPKVGHNDV